jgi:hypothetical protein
MFLLEEIGVEIAMIAAVIVAVLCLAYLTQLSIREQVYLWRLRRGRGSVQSGVVPSPKREVRSPAEGAAKSDGTAVLPPAGPSRLL